MSYQWVPVSLQNTKKIATNAYPLIVDLSPITGNDASFLRVSVEVGSFAGAGTASLSLEHSHDNGKTWEAVTSLAADTVNATGTFTVETTASSGILSPNVRIVITPQAGVSLSLTNLRKTFSPGPIIPTAATGGATEATLLDILTEVTNIDAKDFATEFTLSALLTAFNLTDFATETTLNGLLTAFNAEDFASETTLAGLLAAFNAEDFASETTLASLLAAFNSTDFATQTTLAAVGIVVASILTELQKQASGVDPQTFVSDHSATPIPVAWGTTFYTTTADVRELNIFDDSGSAYELGWGGVSKLLVAPGGTDGSVKLHIPNGTAVELRSLTGAPINTGSIYMNMVG